MSARGLAGALTVLLLSATSWGGAGLPTITHDGRPYVELARVAASLQTRLDATPASTRAHLRTRDTVVTLTRNWAQVLINGKPMVLDAPVRVKRGVWLVPQSFVGRVGPTLVAGAPAGAAPSRVGAPVEVSLEDLRVRSYPSFTRVVVETSASIAHRVESSGPKEARVRLAGHGGHDSGALGPTGLMEKDVVLDVTRRVTKLVEERLGVKVRLTRDADHFVTLRDRTSFANRERADLFVSIHANAHRESATDGVETYFLSSEATDSAARQVAALENSAVQLEQSAGRPSGQVDIVKAILWDLAQSEFHMESSRLAEVVHDSMTQSLRISNRGVKQAGFYVLGGAAMPAIRLEIGFVTNPREERRLKETKYRDEIARAIFAGLAEYKRAWDQRARAAAEPPSMTRAR